MGDVFYFGKTCENPRLVECVSIEFTFIIVLMSWLPSAPGTLRTVDGLKFFFHRTIDGDDHFWSVVAHMIRI